MNISFEILGRLSQKSLMAMAMLIVTVTGAFDFWAGPEIGFSLFYLIPIYLVTWFSGKRSGIVISFACAFIWFVNAELVPARAFPESFVSYWNVFVRLSFFIVIVLLETELKDALLCATTDPLTSLGNRRYFFEAGEKEIKKLQRYGRPFTAVYIDIDNFKAVNDSLGHDAGDRLLKTVARTVKSNIRLTDMFARLGGDEFVLLLPETDAEAARRLIPKLHGLLRKEAMKFSGIAAFSIGVVTFIDPPGSSDEIANRADSVMYSAKKNGKNSIRYDVYTCKPK